MIATGIRTNSVRPANPETTISRTAPSRQARSRRAFDIKGTHLFSWHLLSSGLSVKTSASVFD
jgi:hypothetical protein